MRAFTILELFVVLLVVGVLAAIVTPNLTAIQLDMQIEGAAANVVSLLERGRSEAAKRGVPVVLIPSFGGERQSEILIFADYYDASTGTEGSDLAYSAANDVLITRWLPDASGKSAIRFWSPLDENPEGDNAVRGFTSNPQGADLPPVIVFNGSSIESLGTISLGLSQSGRDELQHCREVEVALLSGQARIEDCEAG